MDGHASLHGIHGFKREETPPYHYLLGLGRNSLGFEERLSIRKPFCTPFGGVYPDRVLVQLARFRPNAREWCLDEVGEGGLFVRHSRNQQPLVYGSDLLPSRYEVEYHTSREVHQYEACKRVSQIICVASVGFAAHFDLEYCHSIRREGEGPSRSIELFWIVEHVHLVMLASEGVHG